MTPWIRIGLYALAAMMANSVGFVTWDPESARLSVDVAALSALLGTPGLIAGAIGGPALAWWRWAKRKGLPT